MQQLVHAGVLKGVRGPRGGYTLARERRRISVGEVIRVINELDGEPVENYIGGSALGQNVLHPLWQGLQADFMNRLDAITLDDLCGRARDTGIKPETRDPTDFTI
jgi:Rrf2 family protein